MFLVEWFKNWVRAWIIYFWLVFVNLLSSSEAVSSTDDGIIYIDEDRFPIKRKSIDGKEDYMRVVQSAGEIRKRLPKKEPLKRTKSSGGVNSLVHQFEKRSKSLDQEDEEPQPAPIRKAKRKDLPLTKLERRRSAEKYDNDTMHAPRPKEEATETPENTDALWNQLVAQYAANETIEQVATLRSFSKESTEKEDPDDLLDKLLSRIDNEPAEFDIERKPAVTGEIEAQLEKAIIEGDSRGEDQIFIVFEDSTDNDSDEHTQKERISLDRDENLEKTQPTDPLTELSSNVLQQIPSIVISEDIPTPDDTIEPVTEKEEISSDKSLLNEPVVNDVTIDDVNPPEEPPPTMNIVVQSVIIEPCSSIPIDIDSVVPDEDTHHIEDEFDALWKEAEPPGKNIDALYEECLAPISLMGSTSKYDELGDILLPNNAGIEPVNSQELLKAPIIPEDTKCDEVICSNAEKAEEESLLEIKETAKLVVTSIDGNEGEAPFTHHDTNIYQTESKQSFDEKESAVTDELVIGEDLKEEKEHLSQTADITKIESVENQTISESMSEDKSECKSFIPVNVNAQDSDAPVSIEPTKEDENQSLEKTIMDEEDSVHDPNLSVSEILSAEPSEEPFMAYITSSSSVIIIDEDDNSIGNEEPMKMEDRIVPDPTEIDSEDQENAMDVDTEIEEVLNKLAAAHPQGNGLQEAFSIPDEDVRETPTMVVTYSDDDTDSSNIPTCVPTEIHCSSPSKMVIDACKIEEVECPSPTLEDQITTIDLMKVSRQLSNGAMSLKGRFGLADIPEEQEPSESMDQEDSNSELSDDCFEPEVPKEDPKPEREPKKEEGVIPTYLEEVKDLLVPRARRKKQKRFKELDEIMKVDENKVKPRVNMFASREDLTNLTDSDENDSIPPPRRSKPDTLLNSELFTEEERMELSELATEKERVRAIQRKELEKYLSLPSALTEQEHQELAELLAEEETEKRLDSIGEERLAQFLEDVRKRMAEPEENDLNHYMNLPLHLTKEEQELLDDEDSEKTRADFQTDDEYKEYIKQKYLEDLEAERIQVEEEYCYDDYSDSYDSEEDYEYEENDSLRSSNIPITTNTL